MALCNGAREEKKSEIIVFMPRVMDILTTSLLAILTNQMLENMSVMWAQTKLISVSKSKVNQGFFCYFVTQVFVCLGNTISLIQNINNFDLYCF